MASMEPSKPYQVRFSYPLLTRLLIGLSFVLPMALGVLMIWAQVPALPTLGVLAFALFELYLFCRLLA